MDAKSRINDAPDKFNPVRKVTTTTNPARGPKHKPQPRRRPGNPEGIIESLLSDLSYARDKVLYWKLRGAASFAWARMNLPRREWRRLFKDKRLNIGIRAAQMQCRIGDNVALRRNCFNQIALPDNIAALYELSALKPDTITRLCEDDLITRKMTTRQAKALVRKALADEAAGTIRPPTLSLP